MKDTMKKFCSSALLLMMLMAGIFIVGEHTVGGPGVGGEVDIYSTNMAKKGEAPDTLPPVNEMHIDVTLVSLHVIFDEDPMASSEWVIHSCVGENRIGGETHRFPEDQWAYEYVNDGDTIWMNETIYDNQHHHGSLYLHIKPMELDGDGLDSDDYVGEMETWHGEWDNYGDTGSTITHVKEGWELTYQVTVDDAKPMPNTSIDISRPLMTRPELTEPGSGFSISLDISSSEENPEMRFFLLGRDTVELNVTYSGTDPGFGLGETMVEVEVPEWVYPGLYDLYAHVGDGREIIPHAVCIVEEFSDNYTFLHITDPHMDINNIEWEYNFEHIISEANFIHPDFIIMTGDLTTHGTLDEFQRWYSYAMKFETPLFVTIGNHDYYGDYEESVDNDVWGNETFRELINPYMDYTMDWGESHFIMMDSGYDAEQTYYSSTGLSDEQMNWLETDLSTNEGAQLTYVGMHHPAIMKWEVGGVDCITISENTEEFIDVCVENGVDMTLSGHVHYDDVFDKNKVRQTGNVGPMEGPIFMHTTSSCRSGMGTAGINGYRIITIENGEIINYTYDYDNNGYRDADISMPIKELDVTFFDGAVEGEYEAFVQNPLQENFFDAHLLFRIPLEQIDVNEGWTTDVGEIVEIYTRGEYLVVDVMVSVRKGCNVWVTISPVEKRTMELSLTDEKTLEGEPLGIEAELSGTEGERELTWWWQRDGSWQEGTDNMEFTFAQQGNYTIFVMAMDGVERYHGNILARVTDTVPVPVINTSATSMVEGEILEMDGSGSLWCADPIIQYNWTLVIEEKWAHSTKGERINVSIPNDGELEVTLTVTDSDNSSISTKMNIMVEDTGPLLNATIAPEIMMEGNTAVLNASGCSAYDGIVNFSWDADDDGKYELYGEVVERTFTSQGDKVISLRVMDGDGSTSTIKLGITVTDSTPTARFNMVGNIARANDTLWFTAGNSSGYDDIVQHQWDFDGDGKYDAHGEMVNYTFSTKGTYNIQLAVMDSDGSVDRTYMNISVLTDTSEGDQNTSNEPGDNGGAKDNTTDNSPDNKGEGEKPGGDENKDYERGEGAKDQLDPTVTSRIYILLGVIIGGIMLITLVWIGIFLKDKNSKRSPGAEDTPKYTPKYSAQDNISCGRGYPGKMKWYEGQIVAKSREDMKEGPIDVEDGGNIENERGGDGGNIENERGSDGGNIENERGGENETSEGVTNNESCAVKPFKNKYLLPRRDRRIH